MEEKQTIFKKIHTEKFRWHDSIILSFIISFVLMLLGQLLGQLMIVLPFRNAIESDESGYYYMLYLYACFIGIWIIVLLYSLIVKKNRPILKVLWTKPKGNNLKFFLIGLLIGCGTNMICAIAAMLHKDIAIYYDSFPVIQLICLFIAVFIQSSAEELLCRGFLYQKLIKSYRHPAVAIIGNSLFFAALHLGNHGVGFLAILDIFVTGIFFSLMVYYMDSIWCAFAAHAAWNYTQNIILGLPNSGFVSPFSIFKLDAAAATNSFAYNVDFGLEGTILAVLVQVLGCVALYLIYHKKDVKPYDPWN